jgi:YidC/Oxa1 family membrane protein insertase
MSSLTSIFHVILYQPILNLFVALYNVIPGHDLGLVVIVVTILIRLILYPITASSINAQKSMQDMQPKLEAIRKQFADDKVKQNQAVMTLYKDHKINPLTSCLPMLIQLPILLALFWALQDGLASKDLAQNLYSFVKNPGTLNPISFGFLNLGTPNIVLAVLSGAAQFVQAKMFIRKPVPKEAGTGGKDESMTNMMNKQMLYFMPVMTILIGIKFPSGLTLYWFFGTALMALQQWWILRNHSSNKKVAEGVIEGTIVK